MRLLYRNISDKRITSKTFIESPTSSGQANKTTNSAFCPTCGAPVLPEDSYCLSCGTKLKT